MRTARIALVATLLGTMLALSPAVTRAEDAAGTRADEADLTHADDAPAATRTNDCRLHIAEWSLLIAGGGSRRVQYYALHGDVGFTLWSRADRWLAEHSMTGRWIVEPWVAFVNDEHNPHKSSGVEIGVSPLFAKLTFGDGRLRPFLEGGEGILYTNRRKSTLGNGGFFFSSQIGGGLEYELRPGLALTFALRYRHISTAGITSDNAGLNTAMALIGLTFR